MGFTEFFHQFKENRLWRTLILLVNVGGIAYGFYYYRYQFFGHDSPFAGADVNATPWYLWFFVPDSPMAVLWAEVALIAYSLGRRSNVLDALAVVTNVQVGLWSAFVLLFYEDRFNTLDPTSLNFTLFWLHLGMVAQAFIFLHDLRGAGARLVAGILAWGLFHDYMDYAFPFYGNYGCDGLRPYTIPCEGYGVTAAVTVGLTLLATGLLAFYALRPPPGRRAPERAAESDALTAPRK
ncbi:MAG TPA: DUF1405 domain-containing protein [Candidatus Thermoplasmatota archaeon]|nr:DUF1405 domain-containing protein [Candidatus Thermoplasmatota archaeon]